MATEDIIARYQLDISDLKLQVKNLETEFTKLSDSEKKAAKEGEEAFKKTAKEADNTKKKIDETGKSTNAFQEQIEGLGKNIVAAFAVESILAFAKSSVKAFADAESQAKKLQNAVSISGGLNKDFERLIAQSSKLQDITIFSDDDIQATQTAALQYGFTAQQVEKLIPTLADLASATGGDLQSALNSVIAATEGSEKALRGQGVTIDTTIPKAENFNKIVEQLNKTFENQAVIVGETAAGALKIYQNQAGELEEQIGEKLFPAFQTFYIGLLSASKGIIDLFTGDIFKSETIAEKIERDTNFIAGNISDLSKEQLNETIKINQEILKSNGARMASLNKESSEYKKLSDANQIASNRIKIYSDELISRGQKNVVSIDLQTLSTEKLIKRRDELKVKNDFNSRSEIETIDKILKKREDEQKKQDELNKKNIEQRKQALEQLQKFADDANEKELLATAKNEQQKLEIQRQAALNQAQELFKSAGGAGNIEAVKAFNEATLSINAQYDELIKQAKLKSAEDTYKQLLDLSNKNSDEDLKNTINNIEAGANTQILALKQSYLERGDFSKEAEKKLQDDITAIQLDAERKRIEETFKFKQQSIENEKQLQTQNALERASIEKGFLAFQLLGNKDLQKELISINQNANEKQIENKSELEKALKKLGITIVDNEIKNNETANENWVLRNEEKIRQTAATAGEIINLFNSILESQIANKERELEILQEGFAKEEEELQFQYEKRLIGAGDFEIAQNKLKEKRIASEKKIQEEINKLKRQEDIANRARAIFEIGINTAVAIANALGKPGAAFLIPLIAIAGAAQAAAVLATPLPKYAKGTKYLQRGNNPSGTDTIPILADEGERIIPRKQNKKYWNIYEAIDDGRFEDFMYEKYISPHLENQKKSFAIEQSKNFANSIANSFLINEDKLAQKIGAEIEWRTRNGLKVKGVDAIIETLNKEIDPRKK